MQKYGKITGDLNMHFLNMFDDFSTVEDICQLFNQDLQQFWQIINQYSWSQSIQNLEDTYNKY